MQSLRQDLRLKQELVLQPQQILRAELIQMPLLELEMRIRAEIEENPFLEEVTDNGGEEGDISTPDYDEDLETPPTTLEGESPEIPQEEKLKELSEEVNWDDLMNDTTIWEYRVKVPPRSEEDLPEPVQPAVKTFLDSLYEQLQLDNLSPVEREIGEDIIGNLDHDGYLRGITLEEIAQRKGVSLELVQGVHKRILSYDPPGIGARDLQECLLAQLEVRRPRHPLAEEIVANYWEDLINKRYEQLQSRLGVSLDEIREAFGVISHLNPKPGEGYGDERDLYVVPDLIVTRIGDELEVFLNDGNIPHFRLNTSYYDLVKQKSAEREVKEFLTKKLESARWFISALHQRRITMLRTMRAIVQRQQDFFLKGPQFLKPMILKDIADDTGLDISTISRVTNGKFVQTDWGVFELKYFFSESIPTAKGEEVSNRIIKQRLQELIAREDKRNPLTDLQLTELLKKEGFQIERRTVAKYREMLGIPVRRLRRQV